MTEPRARRAFRRPEPLQSRAARLLIAAVVATLAGIAGPLAAVAAGAGAGAGARAATGGGGGGGSGGGGLSVPATTTTATTTTTTVPATTTTTTTTTTPYSTTTTVPVIAPGPAGNPFQTRGMWIWIMSSTDGGSLTSIVDQAKTDGMHTLFIKSSDGIQGWSQFNSTVVSTLHEAGLHVCAWQFVYGIHPVLEAQQGADAVRDGADCLVIDAEGQYQGKYVQAQTYITTLRKLIGANFPVALAGLPYIDYHPGFPYSVFLGPGGAQYNLPQMYWADIGTSVAAVYAHTYEFNALYERPIAPLGQLFDNPPLAQVRTFRAVSRYYGAKGISWWDWQNATAGDFRATVQPVGAIKNFTPDTTVASLGNGALGDVVVWAQEHLVSAGAQITIDGDFGPLTQAAVEQFQLSHGLPETGVIDPGTWAALLAYKPVTVKWVNKRKTGLTATITRAGVHLEAVPKSASMRQRGNELHGDPGAGRPARP
jgi:hypothetical protein